ncbi:D-alanyl-D-alanine carboxypeptidase/D-alanyl-D-alanine endopeptidase [Salegentibacter salegens]|uniref:D-alanyl-D-alanine carboxypeptidase / D-alanyl-D-alanine-endopeptidase (Penicillin-binding protein 4) n=1 Tax=Salegentibacter salegens TaxID=143223 RepID=A0A1M7I2Z4_9FLAO|nr:D-alanyl-D-alanine carboxypeptidase/D-alanyl-D-alanine-endopeptidase [Salegentibacter salegens]PRX45312.1 D-alanyl-D-alanine carboxypeptidase/D-alanyl-D-alanine-endopeptidase (penicillin-binding protein 4) [Salegentibacter salegens]SHM34999.1 D-alanyl-D-alanine carboxypeptidase / D-alanyl-D-alanine-endopeptidase (penicillin-binding protein 4) [Salegentibacter salegens]
MKIYPTFKLLLKNSVFFLIIIALASCSTTRKISKPLDKIFTQSPVFEQGFAGFMLVDPEKDKTIYSHNADKYFTPASNTKLFTFYAGLKILGDSIPALKYSIKNDTLYFKATGDPSFLNENLPKSSIFEFLKNNSHHLVYVEPSYIEKHQGPGWAWDDYNAYYSAERTAFPIYGNMVGFKFKKNEEFPVVSPSIFKDSLISSKESFVSTRLRRDLGKNSFQFNNQKKQSEFSQSVPFKYSSEILLKLLNDTLQKPISLVQNSEINKNLDNTRYSIPSDSVYKEMLKVSDNFIAEQILIMAAGKISDTLKSNIAIDYMKENHLKDLPDEPMWYDGSGLSRYNLFTPRSIVKLLKKIRAEVPEKELLDMLPTGGHSGTIKNYYKADEPYVFAKTGTLKNNHSLSGYLKTKSGKILIFSFMNSNYTVPTTVLKAEMEKVLLNIRDNY